MLLRSVRLHFATGPLTELPARILVGKWGRNASVKGDYTINETTARELPGNLKKVGYDSVALDFDHNSVKGSAAYKAEQEPRKVAAHGTLSVVAGEGLFFQPATWTPEGKDAVLGGHFPDLSPAILTNAAGEVIFVDSVALCRQGATEGLHLDLHSAGLGALSSQPSPTAKPTMDAKYKALLLLILGLPETADDAAIEAAAKTLGTKLDTATSAANGATTAVQTMSVELKRLGTLLEGNEKDRLITEAIASGKLITQSIQDLPLEHFKKIVADLPAGVVPLERRTPKDIQTHSASVINAATVAAEAEVNRQLGIKAKA